MPEELKAIGKIEIKQNQKGTFDVILEGVQVSFFYYPNKMINQYVTSEEMPNLKMASVIMGLSYFEDAEQEILPETFVEYDWDEIKNFFINFQKEFQNEMNKLVD